MLRVYACIVDEHDLRLVVLAGLICLLAAFTAFSIVEQARRAGKRRIAWLVAAGFVSGTGIWSTHFLAMLAYEPHLPIGYDPGLTLVSILAAMALSGIGWWLSLRPERWAPLAAGSVIGGGIATMHYIGMSAVTLAGRFLWDRELVAASVVIGILLSSWAIAVRRSRVRADPHQQPWPAALLFTLAICGLHFTAMGAASVIPDPNVIVPESAIGSTTLGAAVTLMALVILAIAFSIVMFDRKLHNRAEEEARRLRTFADAAIEGLLVVDGDRIVDANKSFLRIAGYRPDLCPGSLSTLLPDLGRGIFPATREKGAAETRLIRADGLECPVEILARPLDWAGVAMQVLAVRDISERKEAAARIAHLAYHDALTGLPNRAVFAEGLADAIESAAASGEPVAVLCIDLDGFKAVNDLMGHAAGDELLVEAAQRLRALAGPDHLAARLGGDEFAIVQRGGVQRGGGQPHAADLLAKRVLAALAAPFPIAGKGVAISCSVGVALYPQDASTPGDLVKNADMALYRAKSDGRGTARFYEVRMDEALRERRLLEADLHLALDRGEMHIHYQPLACLESGTILGFEALLRWNHPERGAIGPDVFIPLAEESGFIVGLGAWVLRRACEEAAEWQDSLRIAVNLSPVQFTHGDLAAEVEAIVRETGLDPTRLDLEITEGLLIKDADRALAILGRLKALGVKISMDDFGTGYSSLSYFRMFPFDKVKIDQSFIRDMMDNPQARAIVRSVIGLGQGLGMPVVAEGVETDAQFQALVAEGCDQVQGYLISRPGPIEQFDRVVIERRVKAAEIPVSAAGGAAA
jgi:diguanylate cyclase (GGDEF)-like protein/PAS domain S-box-containing protein